jgi:DNA-binding NarL/FixJ family response regulator
VLTAPEGSITVPVAIAVAVHTLPALALLLTVHVAAVTVYSHRADEKVTAPRKTPAPKPTFTVTPVPGQAPKLEVTTTTAPAPQRPERAEVLALRANGLSIRQIADQTGVAKSTVSRWTSATA